MRAPARGSRAEWLLGSGFARLHCIYLQELELVAAGVPEGPLLLAPALRDAQNQATLFAEADSKDRRAWAAALVERLGPVWPPDDRAAWLSVADEARHGRHWRRAVQLHGWLLLTSTSADDAFRWSVFRLSWLAREVYGPALN